MGTPPTIEFASLGMWDSFILMVMALVVFGPRRLPEIGRQIGKLMYEFRKASNDFKFQMEEELRTAEDADRRKKEEERVRALPVPAAQMTIEAGASVAANEASVVHVSTYGPALSGPGDVAAEETYPRILPPSSGEQVPASRPNGLAGAAHEPELASGSEFLSDTAVSPHSAPDPEQVAHHD
jgi:sec-independent protein translocase protein TatB